MCLKDLVVNVTPIWFSKDSFLFQVNLKAVMNLAVDEAPPFKLGAHRRKHLEIAPGPLAMSPCELYVQEASV